MQFPRAAFSFISALCCSLACMTAFAAEERPNIVYILADDMGYGDVKALNPERGKIPTPHMDKLVAEGMSFTDAHTNSSVCTPTRYGILTGRYSWRTRLQSSVLFGYGKPLISDETTTVPELLKTKGYKTAMFGKWHLGLEFPTKNDRKLREDNLTNIDWEAELKGGPVDHGFDYFFGIPASLDMYPYIYLENKRFIGRCTVFKSFPRRGPAQRDFEAIEVMDDLKEKTLEFIKAQDQSTPFFTYIALPSPHTPIVPTEEWQGKSGLGDYADYQMQTDAFIGSVADAIDEAGLGENTIFIVTSDNGCSPAADIEHLESEGHFPSAVFRGYKSDLWDGGHRVPFIVRWPKVIKPGTKSDAIICTTDLFATAADVSGAEVAANAGVDSVSFLPALKGEEISSERPGIVHHSIHGNFAYRMGKWKLLLAKGSGGWSDPKESDVPGDSTQAQLYDMEADPGETNNLYESEADTAKAILDQLKKEVENGRSTPGPAQANDVDDIVLWK